MRQLLKGCVRARPRDRCRESLSEQGHEATSILLHHLSASLSERTRLKIGEGSGLHVSSPPLRPSRADARAPDRQASDRQSEQRESTRKNAMTIPVAMVVTDELLPLAHICPTRFNVDPSLPPPRVIAVAQHATCAREDGQTGGGGAVGTRLQVVRGAHARLHHLERLVLLMHLLVDRDGDLPECSADGHSPSVKQACRRPTGTGPRHAESGGGRAARARGIALTLLSELSLLCSVPSSSSFFFSAAFALACAPRAARHASPRCAHASSTLLHGGLSRATSTHGAGRACARVQSYAWVCECACVRAAARARHGYTSSAAPWAGRRFMAARPPGCALFPHLSGAAAPYRWCPRVLASASFHAVHRVRRSHSPTVTGPRTTLQQFVHPAVLEFV